MCEMSGDMAIDAWFGNISNGWIPGGFGFAYREGWIHTYTAGTGF
jgi:hypothetical protein